MNKLTFLNEKIGGLEKSIEGWEKNLFLDEVYGRPQDRSMLDADLENKKKLEEARDKLVEKIKIEQQRSNIVTSKAIFHPPLNSRPDITIMSADDIKNFATRTDLDNKNVDIRIPMKINKNKSFKDNWKMNAKLVKKIHAIDEKFKPMRDLREMGK